MRLNESPLLAQNPESDYDRRLYQSLYKLFRDIVTKVNQMASGTATGFDGALTAPPTTGTWAQGDFVRKSNPVEAGGAGAKYIITGWVRVTSGSGNVLNTDWFEHRVLTGN